MRRRLLLPLLLGALVLGLGLRPMARALGHALIRQDRMEEGSAIVVLGGDVHRRAPHAALLWRMGLAPLVVTVGGTAGQGELAESAKSARVLVQEGLPASAIRVLDDDAPSTQEEAQAIARLAAAEGWTRLLVVTSPYHTRRAGALLDAAAPGVEVRMMPSPLDPYDPDGWWRDPVSRRRVRNELAKYLLWRTGLRGAAPGATR